MAHTPSTDLYFRNALAPWIKPRWRPSSAPIRPIGANSFIAGDWFILIRRDTPALMRAALAWPGPLAYVVDDDIAAGAQCPSLPAPYRARLAAFLPQHQALLDRAHTILTASNALTQTLAAAPSLAPRLRRIDPVWRQPLASTAHFKHTAPLKIVHLGTGSHHSAQTALAPIILAALNRHPNTSFTYFSPRRLSDALERHPRAQRLEPMTWSEYQRWMARQRFHLALYPLAQTVFDRARSASKLCEHAILGAVGLYPQGWSPAQILGPAALLAPDDPEDWACAIDAILANPANLVNLAENAAQTLTCINPCAVQQTLWRSLISLDVR